MSADTEARKLKPGSPRRDMYDHLVLEHSITSLSRARYLAGFDQLQAIHDSLAHAGGGLSHDPSVDLAERQSILARSTEDDDGRIARRAARRSLSAHARAAAFANVSRASAHIALDLAYDEAMRDKRATALAVPQTGDEAGLGRKA